MWALPAAGLSAHTPAGLRLRPVSAPIPNANCLNHYSLDLRIKGCMATTTADGVDLSCYGPWSMVYGLFPAMNYEPSTTNLFIFRSPDIKTTSGWAHSMIIIKTYSVRRRINTCIDKRGRRL